MAVQIGFNVFFLAFIGLLLFILKKKIDKPGYLDIYSSLWFILLIGSQWAGYPYSANVSTLFVFYLAWIFFLLPSLFFYGQSNSVGPIIHNYVPNANRLRLTLLALMVISLLVNVVTVYSLSGSLNFIKFGLVALRLQGRKLLDEQSTILYQLFAKCFIIYVPLAMIGYKYKYISKLTLFSACFIGLFTCIITLTRAPILSWAVTIITASSVCFNVTQRRFYTYIFFLISPVIITTMLFGMDNEELLEMAKLYIFGGIKAYETVLSGKYPDMSFYDVKLYSIDFINYILKKASLIERYPSLVREYTYAPSTNVYTYLDAGTLDFGVAGAILSASILGAIAAYIHHKAHVTRDVLYVSYYCFINYTIAISFMNNELIRINGFILLAELLIIRAIIKPASVPFSDSSLLKKSLQVVYDRS
ncbi:O-antigen polymerase [Larkinella insperata]|uniref:O-antigen polymerase n=1 Tax=Larkinella insperata TaxID=332158 RepID=A0ABW3Q3T3_9BACT|nr:O-antigen polymerase [Larkinella insperata]